MKKVSMKKVSMKSLIVKKERTEKKTAQCCAKVSAIVVGCHD